MIVLLTDFGLSEYVGVMKGAIYRIDGNANERLKLKTGEQIELS